jgi:uncharacterized coiled-coil protein SlyX
MDDVLSPGRPQETPQQQGMAVTLEELYQVIGEKEMLRFKLQGEVVKLTNQVAQLQQELLKKGNGNA